MKRIIVAGIYRSGTSLLTELVHRWGAYAGREEDIFKDEFGYMEHFALQKLNDELLNNNSRVPTPVETLLEKAADAGLRERALSLLSEMDQEAQANHATAWVWKDPRLPLVLPFWADIWGDVVYVIPVRHPVETIFSAARMDGLDPDQIPLSAGLAYWQFCMLNLLQFTANTPRKLFMGYDQLTANPARECERLCRFLDEQCQVNSDPSDRIRYMTEQVTAGERHFTIRTLSQKWKRPPVNSVLCITFCASKPCIPMNLSKKMISLCTQAGLSICLRWICCFLPAKRGNNRWLPFLLKHFSTCQQTIWQSLSAVMRQKLVSFLLMEPAVGFYSNMGATLIRKKPPKNI